MSANDILFRYQPSGASSATAWGQSRKLQKEQTVGVVASQELAKSDLVTLKTYTAHFLTVAQKYDLPPALLAAIASRESHGGKALDAEGWGDNKNAFGMMQVDRNYHGIALGDPCGREHVDQATSVLKGMLKEVTKKHSDWPEEQQLRGAVAAYNCGAKNIWTTEHMDEGTTGNDYSNDVWARAQFLAPYFGGAQTSVADIPVAPNTGMTPAKSRPGPSAPSRSGTASTAVVSDLQHLLVRYGYMTEAEVNTGLGVLGPKTKAAVARFLNEKTRVGTGTTGNAQLPLPPPPAANNPPPPSAPAGGLLPSGPGASVNTEDPILKTLATQPLNTGETGFCTRTTLTNMRRLGIKDIPSSTGSDPNNPRGALAQMLLTGKWASVPMSGSRLETIKSNYGTVQAYVIPAGEYEKQALAGKVPSGAVIFQTKHGWDYSVNSSGNDMGLVRDNGRQTFNYEAMSPLVYKTCKSVVLLVPASAILRS